jgi:hypothetical protein
MRLGNESHPCEKCRRAEITERVCYGIELDPKYVDTVVIRWQNLTGGEATLDGDGRTFEQVKAERVRSAA